MCGIVGAFYFDRESPVDEKLLLRQTDALVHRGPDDGAVWTSTGIGLGHRRLSIIDLDSGSQPMFDPTGRRVIVFNGEIYNYREIRDELVGLGHSFRTTSDTEVLLAAYGEWAERCLDKLTGMFAFAIYDRQNHHLFLARDRMGKKPLYYYCDRQRVVFGSELKAIVMDPMVPRQTDATAVADFFALAYIPGPKTIFRAIHKLQGGHYAIARPGRGLSITQYWDVDYRTGSESEAGLDIDAVARQARATIDEAVRLRLRSDVPLGAFLSGGLDSSTVVVSMASQTSQPVVTQSIGFDVARYDETKYASQIAQQFYTDHTETRLNPSVATTVEHLAYFYDEPFGDSSALPTYFLCEATRKRVTVALSGDGGDELFAGYDHYPMANWAADVRSRLPDAMRPLMSMPLERTLDLTRSHRPLHKMHKLLWHAATTRDRSAYHHLLSQPHRYRAMLASELQSGLRDYDPFETMAHLYDRSGTDDLTSRMQYADTKAYLADDILVKVDRASMAHGLEVRCPLLDHHLVQYAASLPTAFKLVADHGKHVLRLAARDWISPSFFDREKQGFAIPAADWLRTGLRDLAGDVLLSNSGSRLLSRKAVSRLWDQHQGGSADHAAQLWNAMMFELWHTRYASGTLPVPVETEAVIRARPTRVLSTPPSSFAGAAIHAP